MGGRPQSEVARARPVGGVVPRSPTRAGEVGNLVVLEASLRRYSIGLEKFRRVRLLSRSGNSAPCVPVTKRCGLLDRKTVQRDVIRLEIECFVQIGYP